MTRCVNVLYQLLAVPPSHALIRMLNTMHALSSLPPLPLFVWLPLIQGTADDCHLHGPRVRYARTSASTVEQVHACQRPNCVRYTHACELACNASEHSLATLSGEWLMMAAYASEDVMGKEGVSQKQWMHDLWARKYGKRAAPSDLSKNNNECLGDFAYLKKLEVLDQNWRMVRSCFKESYYRAAARRSCEVRVDL
eukprot:6188715-Pleurochrysis_carterae.AAC.1